MEQKITFLDMIDNCEEQPPIWVAYPGAETFKVLVRPLGRRQAEFVEAATEPTWDMATMIKRQTMNPEKYLDLFLKWVVVDWQGLSVAVLRRLVLLHNWEQLKLFQGEIGCDAQAKLLLTRFSPAFSIWINRVCLDVERFNAEREAEAEKKP
ncbi:MAG: hypothetical protein Q7W05_12795 [Deltaproteobacteria bacterium]|jgi:hypothetical protein|nr:hypothetical protein [Deltaproteobacteria bacterium]